jgi:hypothetical protein
MWKECSLEEPLVELETERLLSQAAETLLMPGRMFRSVQKMMKLLMAEVWLLLAEVSLLLGEV